MTNGDREAAQIITSARVFWREIIGEAVIVLVGRLFILLPQKVKSMQNFSARFVSINFHAIPDRIGGPEAEDRLRRVTLLGHNLREHFLRIRVEFRGLFADDGISEDFGEATVEFPRREKGGPINELNNLAEN